MDETGDIEPSEYESIKEELLKDLFGNHRSLDPFNSNQKIPRTPDSQASNRSRPLTGDVPLPTRSVSPPVPKPSSRGQDPGRCFQDCIQPCRSMKKRHFHCKICDYISDRLDNMKRHIPYHFLTIKKERRRAPDGIKMVGHEYFTGNCSDENCRYRNKKYTHFHCILCKTWGCNGKKNYKYRLKHLSNAHNMFFGEKETPNVAVERKRTEVGGTPSEAQKIAATKKLLPFPAAKEEVLNARRRAKHRSRVKTSEEFLRVKTNEKLSGVKTKKDDAGEIPVTIDYLNSVSQDVKRIMQPLDGDDAENLTVESDISDSVTVASEASGYARTPLETSEYANASLEFPEHEGMTEESSKSMDEGIANAACETADCVSGQLENSDHETLLQETSESMDLGSQHSLEADTSTNSAQLPTNSDAECSITLHGSMDTILEILNTLQKNEMDISDQRDLSSLSTVTDKKGFLNQLAAIIGDSSSHNIGEYSGEEKRGNGNSQSIIDEHSDDCQTVIDQQMNKNCELNRNKYTDQSKITTSTHQLLEVSRTNRKEASVNEILHRTIGTGWCEDKISESSRTSTDEGFSEIFDTNLLNDQNQSARAVLENNVTQEGFLLDFTSVLENGIESNKILDFLLRMLGSIEESKAFELQPQAVEPQPQADNNNVSGETLASISNEAPAVSVTKSFPVESTVKQSTSGPAHLKNQNGFVESGSPSVIRRSSRTRKRTAKAKDFAELQVISRHIEIAHSNSTRKRPKKDGIEASKSFTAQERDKC